MPDLFPGSQTVCYVEREVAYGTARPLNGADAFYTMSESLTPAQEREVRPDRSGSPDHVERVMGRKSAEVEFSTLLLPSGSITTEPDTGMLWQNAFGRLSINATGLEYVQATAHNWAVTVRRAIRAGGGQGVADLQEHVRGVIINAVEIAWGSQGQNGLATTTFRGMGKDWGHTGNTSLASGYVTLGTGNTSFRVAAPKQLSANSLVKLITSISDTGSGASGILVDSVNITTGLVSFNSGTTMVATGASGRAIVPYNPTAVTAGSPIHARVGFLSLDGSATQIEHLGGRITFEDNRGLLNEEVGHDSPSRALREDRRNVTFSLDFLVRRENLGELLSDMQTNAAQNIQVNLGSVKYKTVKIHMKNAEWDMTPVDIPDQGMMRISMAGSALGTNGNDSLKVRFM